MTLILFLVFAVVFLAMPDSAYAWGPVTHIVHGTAMLADLAGLPPKVASVIAAHPNRYLYGCVGADIIQAKAYTRSLATHCHRWPVAWTLVKSAKTEQERAFAWGYMTHLGADILSHNHFVPSHLVKSFATRTAGHAYWEARADSLQDPAAWRRLSKVLAHRYEDCDELVNRVIKHTLFSFKTNKRIFDSLMAVSKLERWRDFVENLNNRSRYRLTRATVEWYNEAAIASALDLLSQGQESYTQALDPTGADVLARATAVRRRLRTLKRSKRLTRKIEEETLRSFVPEDLAGR